jgi:hypothetical protein
MKSDLPYVDLNINLKPLRDDFILPTVDPDKQYYHVYTAPENILNRELIVLLKELGVPAAYAILLFKRGGFNGPPHVDCHYVKDKWVRQVAALNFKINDNDSEMRWFRPESKKIKYPNPKISQPWVNIQNCKLPDLIPGSFFFDEPHTEPYASTKINNPTLVRTEIVHDIKNTNVDRWAITIRFDYNLIRPWGYYVSKFSKYKL